MEKSSLPLTPAVCLFLLLFSFLAGQAQTSVTSRPEIKKEQVKETKTNIVQKDKTVPRVELTGTDDKTSIKGKSTNLLIYNTATAGTGKTSVTPGYYHNVGTTEKPEWKRVEVTVEEAVKTKDQK